MCSSSHLELHKILETRLEPSRTARPAILAIGIKGALRRVRVGAPVVAAAVVRRRAGVGAARGGVGQEEEGEQST